MNAPASTPRWHSLRPLAVIAFLTIAPIAGAATAHAGEPTCADMFGLGWKNHGEHVLGYVHSEDGAAGGAPAHLAARPDGPAPGASFCLDEANSPGMHLSDFGG